MMKVAPIRTLSPSSETDVEPAMYYGQRELIERAAAATASCPEAKRVHQQLADRYAELAREPCAPTSLKDDHLVSAPFVVLTRA
jgi:hypothetical protein